MRIFEGYACEAGKLGVSVRTLSIGSSPPVDATVQDLLEHARGRPTRRLAPQERRVEFGVGVLFVLIAMALVWLLPSPRPLSVGTAVALTLVFAIASRVEFATGAGSTVPTQLVFVPMLFLLPTPAVPVFVAAGLLLGRLPRYVRGDTPIERAIVELGDALFSIGPVVVLSLAGADTPTPGDWPIYLLALASQFTVDIGVSTVRAWIGLGAPPGVVSREVTWICAADLLLTPVGFVAALATVTQPYAFLLLFPLLGILALSARDRGLRIEQGHELWSAYRGSVLLLDRVVGADNRSTGEHGRGVVDLAMRVGDELGIDGRERVELEFVALLHDVGKIAIDNEIINKRGALTAEEFVAIKTHTIEGHRMLQEVGGLLGRVGVVVRSCHERWDGAGYPDGLAGTAIPLTARIVFCCDAFHAMTTDRSYRAARSPRQALDEIQANAGSQFDPTVVHALTRALGADADDASATWLAPSNGGTTRALARWQAERPAVASDEGLIGLSSDGTIRSMNSAAVRLLGWTLEEAAGRRLHELVLHSYPNGRPYPREASPIEAALSRRPPYTAETVDVLWCRDGAALPVRYTIRPVTADEAPPEATLEFKPLVARSPAEEALRLGEELSRSLARNLEKSTVMLFDHTLRLLVVEGESLARRDLEHEALTRWRLEDFLPEDAWARLEQPARAALRGKRTELEFSSHDGSRFYRVTVGPMRDDLGAVQAGLAVAEDVTQSHHRAERLDRLAHHDDLTGLTNRAAFHELVDKTLRRAARSQRMSALLFIDLDGFKPVNDTQGHQAGDEVLRGVASRLRETTREIDTVARLGGDEFAVLLDGVQDEAEAAAAAERILAALAEPFDIDGSHVAEITASVGIALQSAADQTSAQLLSAADAAMYRAKGLGGNCFRFFDPAADRSADDATDRHGHRALAHAADRDELTIDYQPEVDVESGEVVAVEALVRWRHPSRGLLLPADFLMEAELDGVIDVIDGWVMSTACAQGTAWSGAGLPPFRIAVNVSRERVLHAGFEDSVRRSLQNAGLPASRLELDVPGRILADFDRPGETAMRRLQGDGVRISIDHFGTEHLPLDRLETFPADALKIDGRFVRSLPGQPRMAVSLIELAHNLGFEVIAEGVETAEQLTILRGSGCDVAVGHAISHPVPAEQLTTWLHTRMEEPAD
jgi:diguanylate cyclase (GGDEF)-like protein/PAS domain S-box-containing protein